MPRSEAQSQQGKSACLSLLRGESAPLYFSVLFAPREKREALAALLLFQQQILRIGAQVKEPLLGEMRLQYWRQNLERILNKNTQCADNAEINSDKGSEVQSPVAAALFAAAEQYALPLEPLWGLCDAARFEFYDEPMGDCAALEQYCDAVYGAILLLLCHILKGGALSEAEAAACRAGGRAQGIAELIRHLPRHMAQGKFYIPSDLAAGIGADRAELAKAAAILRKADGAESAEAGVQATDLCRRAIAALLAMFQQNYRLFAAAEKTLPPILRPAFLPLALLPAFAAKTARRKQAAFLAPARLSPLGEHLRLVRAALCNRF